VFDWLGFPPFCRLPNTRSHAEEQEVNPDASLCLATLLGTLHSVRRALLPLQTCADIVGQLLPLTDRDLKARKLYRSIDCHDRTSSKDEPDDCTRRS